MSGGWPRRGIWCLLFGLLLIVRVALVGISDPSEGRYAETAREMADGGDWLVPHWQGVAHLEKPPLAYWSAAAGIKLFGRTELAVRLGAALAFLATALLSARIAVRLGGPKAAWPAAAAILAAPYPLAIGPACLTEPFLLFGTALFFHAVILRLKGGSQRALTLAVAAMGVGFLAKGYVIFLFTLLPLAAARTGVFKELWRPRRVLLLLGIVAPWLAAIQIRYPGFLPLQLKNMVGFAEGSGHFHNAPVYIYFVVLGGGLLPYSRHAWAGLREMDAAGRSLLLWWLGLPLVLLTLSMSRSWTYILPATPALAVLAGCGLAHANESRRRGIQIALCALGGIALLVLARTAPAGSRIERVGPVLQTFGFALLGCAIWIWAARRLRASTIAIGTGLLLSASVLVAGITSESAFKIHRTLARRATALAGEGRNLILAGAKLPSVAFYHSREVLYAGHDDLLSLEADHWGQSALYRPDLDPAVLMRSDHHSVLVVSEKLRQKAAPNRPALLTQGGFSIVCGAR